MILRVSFPNILLSCGLRPMLAAMVLLFLLSTGAMASSGPPPSIESVAMLADPGGQWQAKELAGREDAFRPVETRADLSIGYTGHPVWLRLRVSGGAHGASEAVLRFVYPLLEHVSLYRVQGGAIAEVWQSGLVVPPERRAVAHRLPAFPLNLEAGETATLLARVESAGSMALGVELLSLEAFRVANDREMFWLSAYVGLLVALGAYNLLLFVGLQERVFLLYALFVGSFCVAVITANGLGPLLLWSGLGEATVRFVTLGFTLSAALGTLFAQQFLRTRHFAPRWHRALRWLLVACLAGVVGAGLLPRRGALQLMDVVGLVTCLSLLACAVTCAYRRVPGARLFVLAWAFLLVGASIFALRNLGIIPSNAFTLYGIQAGSALEMLLLSFALAARFNTLKRQKEKAQAQLVASLKTQESILEKRVAERTAELEEMARQDTLTGLLNRTGLADRAAAAWGRREKNGSPLAVLMLDLDDFKPINDRFGHATGDSVIQVIAGRLRHQIRQHDHCARIGGDEFLVLCEDLSGLEEVEALKQRLDAAIRQPVRLSDDTAIRVGVSIGIGFDASGTQDLESLMRRADAAMYASKRDERRRAEGS
ncbi:MULTISPECIES: diguanylate cyclase [Halomonas]|uniref:Sensor domain-containing diguanylate cyclase n=1 Tax=Halomonas halophila TaxID=29573 RepID=A0ABQ0U5Z0_9GAMM|nr:MULTISPECIES: diguanylate cyclase [Halomonas]MDR5888013.1 7TM diverse intracellular signaling domain-containing protein [Halomonas salina]WJY08539.1 7TM diverse intracellular signaling domain-containing protein [Halomonas halophila]GEK73887.1 sensor domain-containing diguanylate cyclase [Halomonas halophila]